MSKACNLRYWADTASDITGWGNTLYKLDCDSMGVRGRKIRKVQGVQVSNTLRFPHSHFPNMRPMHTSTRFLCMRRTGRHRGVKRV